MITLTKKEKETCWQEKPKDIKRIMSSFDKGFLNLVFKFNYLTHANFILTHTNFILTHAATQPHTHATQHAPTQFSRLKISNTISFLIVQYSSTVHKRPKLSLPVNSPDFLKCPGYVQGSGFSKDSKSGFSPRETRFGFFRRSRVRSGS